ncbi:transposase [Patescibacteria group bacterium]
MSKRIFTKEEIAKLLKNENVSRCSEKSITYSKDFKTKAVKEYEQGLQSREIFTNAGFDINTIGKNMPKDCLARWNRIYRTKGVGKLNTENRGSGGGRLKKIKNKSDKDKIERLEAENTYLKEENDFLAKLRAKRNY